MHAAPWPANIKMMKVGPCMAATRCVLYQQPHAYGRGMLGEGQKSTVGYRLVHKAHNQLPRPVRQVQQPSSWQRPSKLVLRPVADFLQPGTGLSGAWVWWQAKLHLYCRTSRS